MRSTKTRPYRMNRRAEQVDQTRERITAAAVRLHTTVGPSNTSIAAVAEEAGVTRLTVYRHFADLDALFHACRGHWLATNPPPDASAWRSIPGLEPRARVALSQMYAWYGEHGQELYPIYRDAPSLPRGTQDAMRAESEARTDALLDDIPLPAGIQRSARAVAGHLLGLWTWRSLVVQQGLSRREAVEVAVRMLCAAASSDSLASRR